MTTNHVIVTTPSLVFILISAAFAGGWAIVTLDDFPEYAVAGEPDIRRPARWSDFAAGTTSDNPCDHCHRTYIQS